MKRFTKKFMKCIYCPAEVHTPLSFMCLACIKKKIEERIR